MLRGRVVTHASKGRKHPNAKPLALVAALLEKCPPGPVFDPFMGSGPVAAACAEVGRRYVGVELVEDYCQIAVERLGQRSLFGESA